MRRATHVNCAAHCAQMIILLNRFPVFMLGMLVKGRKQKRRNPCFVQSNKAFVCILRKMNVVFDE